MEYRDERMMQYIDWQQQLLISEQLKNQEKLMTQNMYYNTKHLRNSIWGHRKSMTNKVGFNGNHLGHFYNLQQQQQEENVQKKYQDNTTKLKRILGRITVPFRAMYRQSNSTSRYLSTESIKQPRRRHDDNCCSSNDFTLIAIGYDDWM
jgi:hypothetical protein